MNKKDVEKHAGGRVFSGKEAITRNLADAQGGFIDTLAEVKKDLKIKPKHNVEIEILPRIKMPLSPDIGAFSSFREAFSIIKSISREKIFFWFF